MYQFRFFGMSRDAFVVVVSRLLCGLSPIIPLMHKDFRRRPSLPGVRTYLPWLYQIRRLIIISSTGTLHAHDNTLERLIPMEASRHRGKSAP